MGFEPGKIPDGAKPFTEGASGNPHGRPKGSRNRSTIAREVLALANAMPDGVFTKLKERYPDLTRQSSVEFVMTLIQADKAITSRDTAAYRALLDSAYGAPKQETEISGKDGGPIQHAFNPATMTDDELRAIAARGRESRGGTGGS